MAKNLGQAWIAIGPQLKDFRAKANAEISKAMSGVNDPQVKVSADTRPAVTALDALKAKMAAEAKRIATFRADLDDKTAQAKLLELSSRLDKLGAKIEKPNVDPQLAEAAYLRISGQLDKLGANRTVKISADDSKAAAVLDHLKSLIDRQTARAATFRADLNDKAAQLKLTDMRLKLGELGALTEKPGIDPQVVYRDYLKASLELDKLARDRTVKIDVDRSLISRATGLMEQGLSALGSAGTGVLSGLGGLLANSSAAIGTVAAGLAALPLAGAIAGGGIVAALGGGLTAMAVIGASRIASVKKNFGELKTTANSDLGLIGQPFAGAMNSILATAAKVMDQLTPIFTGASAIISGPFKTFADTLINSLGSPAVERAILAISGAFGTMLKAVTPQIGPDVSQIAKGIADIAKAIAAHPQLVADFVRGLVNIASAGLELVAKLTTVAAWIQTHFWPIMHETAVIWDGARHEIAHVWDMIFQDTVGKIIRGGRTANAALAGFDHEVAVIFDGIRHEIAHVWDMIFSDTIGRVIRGNRDVQNAVNGLNHEVAVIFDGMRHEVAHIWDLVYSDTVGAAIRLGKDAIGGIRKLSDWVANTFGPYISGFFTRTLPGWWDTAVRFALTHFVNPITGTWKKATDWLANTFGPFISGFFTRTIPGWWDSAVHLTLTHFANPVIAAWKTVSDWIQNKFGPYLSGFFTQTLPGWVGRAVSLIGGVWGKLGHLLGSPINTVVTKVVDPLFGDINDLLNFVGIKQRLPTNLKLPGFATGGLVTAGTGPTSDDVLARVSRGETVVSAAHSKMLAPIFGAVGVPGYAQGGIPVPGGGVLHNIEKALANGWQALAKATGTDVSFIANLLNKAGTLTGVLTDLALGSKNSAASDLLGLVGVNNGGTGGQFASALLALPKVLATDAMNFLSDKVKSWVGLQTQAHSGGGISSSGVANSSARAALQSAAAKMGWTGAQWQALYNVEMREAGFNLSAKNPSSGAYGLAQFINGPSEYAQYGGNVNTAAGQATAMVNYIKQRYGTPAAAWAHEQAFGWYGNGGVINEPVIGWGKNSGRGYVFGEKGPETVVPGVPGGGNSSGANQTNLLLAKQNRLLEQLLTATQAAPVQLGRTLTGSITRHVVR